MFAGVASDERAAAVQAKKRLRDVKLKEQALQEARVKTSVLTKRIEVSCNACAAAAVS